MMWMLDQPLLAPCISGKIQLRVTRQGVSVPAVADGSEMGLSDSLRHIAAPERGAKKLRSTYPNTKDLGRRQSWPPK